MQKIVLGVLILFLFSTIVCPQTPDANSPKQVSFSESVAYQPRKFETKTKKQSKTEADKTTLTADANKRDESSKVIAQKPLTIPVSVFDAEGKFIEGLQKSDFRVFVDNKKVEISSFEIRNEPVNVIILIDASPSTQPNLERLQGYALAIVEQLRPQDKVMVVEFNEKLKILSELSTDREQTHKAIRRTKFNNGTSLYEALENLLTRHITVIEGRKALVLLTDGVDTTSRKATYQTSLAEAEKYDLTVFPVYINTFVTLTEKERRKLNSVMQAGGLQGLGPAMNSTLTSDMPKALTNADYERGKLYLNDLIFLSGGRVLAAENLAAGQKGIALSIGEELSRQYLLTVQPSEPARAGQRNQIRVRVNRPNLAVLARGSYIVR